MPVTLSLQAALSIRTVSSYDTPASTTRQLSSRRTSRTGGGAPVGGLGGAVEGAAAAPGELLRPVEEHDGAGCSSPAAAVPAPAPPPMPQPEGDVWAAPVAGQQSSPLRGRRLAPRAADAGAREQEGLACSGPHAPHPPEGPMSLRPSPPRRPPAVPRLAAPPRVLPPQQALEPVQPPPPRTTLPAAPLEPGEDNGTHSCGGASSDNGANSLSTASGAGTPCSAVPTPRAGGGGSHGGSDSDSHSDSGSGRATPEPPDPTGDLSEDLAAIEEWEARTGRVYEFRGLSDAEDEAPPAGDGRSASASPEPARRSNACVPRLTLGADCSLQLQLPLGLGAGWEPGGAAGSSHGPKPRGGVDAESEAEGQLPESPASGSSYRPGYDLEEDFARGYLPADSPSCARSGGSAASGLIRAGFDGGTRDAAAGGREWGSSSDGSGGSARSGASHDGSQTDGGGDGGSSGSEPASPARRGPLVPALNLSAKLAPMPSPGPTAPELGPTGPGHTRTGELRQPGGDAGEPVLQEGAATQLAQAVASDGGGAGPAVDPALASYRARRQVGNCARAIAIEVLAAQSLPAPLQPLNQQLVPQTLNPAPHPPDPTGPPRRRAYCTTTPPCTRPCCASPPPCCSPRTAASTRWCCRRTRPTAGCSATQPCCGSTFPTRTTPPRLPRCARRPGAGPAARRPAGRGGCGGCCG